MKSFRPLIVLMIAIATLSFYLLAVSPQKDSASGAQVASASVPQPVILPASTAKQIAQCDQVSLSTSDQKLNGPEPMAHRQIVDDTGETLDLKQKTRASGQVRYPLLA